jgi:hypothetical protein
MIQWQEPVNAPKQAYGILVSTTVNIDNQRTCNNIYLFQRWVEWDKAGITDFFLKPFMTQVKTSASHLFPEFFYFLIKTLRKRVEEIHSVLEHVLVIQTIVHKIFFFFKLVKGKEFWKETLGTCHLYLALVPVLKEQKL